MKKNQDPNSKAPLVSNTASLCTPTGASGHL